MSVCVYVQHASACLHGRVTIDQYIFLHHAPVSTYVAPFVKLLACAMVFVFNSTLSHVRKALKINFREARLPLSSVRICYADTNIDTGTEDEPGPILCSNFLILPNYIIIHLKVHYTKFKSNKQGDEKCGVCVCVCMRECTRMSERVQKGQKGRVEGEGLCCVFTAVMSLSI